MIATLGYALLGLLAREPLSGYDLAQRLTGRVGFFWQARHSQVYPELVRLEKAGLVSHTVVEQQDRPDKKVYSVTPEGFAAIRAWVTAPMEVSPRRDELLLKAYSIWLADPAEGAALFREHQRRHLDQQADYERRVIRLEGEHGAQLQRPGTPLFATYLTLQRGIGSEREYASWCGWVAAQLERGSGAGGPDEEQAEA